MKNSTKKITPSIMEGLILQDILLMTRVTRLNIPFQIRKGNRAKNNLRQITQITRNQNQP